MPKLLLVFLFFWSPFLLAEERPAEYSNLQAIALPDLLSRSWGADHQILQADKEGRLFLLRKDTLELYELTSGGLVFKGRLARDRSFEVGPPVSSAAMSLDGSSWVLFSIPNHLYVFRHGETEALESPWLVSAVSMGEGNPVVSVAPAEMSTAAPGVLRLKAPPLLQSWNGKEWETMAEGRFLGEKPAGVAFGEHMRGESSTLLAATPERRLWMANEFSYRLRRFSPSGAVQDELTVGNGKVLWSERTEEEWTKAETAARQGGLTGWSRQSLSPVRAEVALRAMAVGRDGAVYLLAQTPQGLALDRFNASLLSLDRVLLQGIAAGRLTMAAGKDGLYIAGFAGRDGIWYIRSEDLERAEWHPVPGAVLNGHPLNPPVEDTPRKAPGAKSGPPTPRLLKKG